MYTNTNRENILEMPEPDYNRSKEGDVTHDHCNFDHGINLIDYCRKNNSCMNDSILLTNYTI